MRGGTGDFIFVVDFRSPLQEKRDSGIMTLNASPKERGDTILQRGG
jgi:hypothetical protein